MAMKFQAEVSLVGFTKKSKAKSKNMYAFLDGEKNTATGLWEGPTYLTYWTDEEFEDIRFGQSYKVLVEIMGEVLVVRNATPVD